VIGSDINSGLYVLRDQTSNPVAGSLAFSSAGQQVQAGEQVQIAVQRLAGSAAVSVGYEIIGIRAEPGLDYQVQRGRLHWAENDSSPKTITLTTLDRGLEAKRELYVRLYHPQQGATLSSPSYFRLQFGEDPATPGVVSFVSDELSVVEADTNVTIPLRRLGGSDGALTVGYLLEGGTATIGEDLAAASGELSWADGDSSERQIVLQIFADDLPEADETAVLRLISIAGSELGEFSELTLTILDTDSNTPPSINLGENRQVNARQTVTITAQVSDQEGDAISYAWQQVSGPAVSLQNTNSPSVSFVAPNSSSQLVLSLTATDARGAASSASISINVIATPPVDNSSSSSGGSTLPLMVLCLSALWGLRRSLVTPHQDSAC
ncbi:Calx-beta domain-containing protein, partial [Arsukibacterium sp.]|uniref:Calx-beta domain-containing protein n=1 Tax=Arsukibacterium sp. TaxID=1977258 RepID=UPI002FD986CA